MSLKLVKDLMVRDVVTISPFSSLREALKMMKKHSISRNTLKNAETR